MQQLSIGAVSRLTQIPTHTLRKWESRHAIAVPTRTETGRRVYTHDQVEQLKLIKTLTADGHALSHLKDLTNAELSQLAGLHGNTELRRSVDAVALVGRQIAHRMPTHAAVSLRYNGELEDWLASNPTPGAGESLVLQADTIPPQLSEQLIALRQNCQDIVVVYSFAASSTLRQLANADIRTLRGPVSDSDIELRLSLPVEPKPQRPQRRFSNEELSRIAALSPGLQCECPNHIARLLIDISAFEQYSDECVDTDLEEASLHRQLGAISAQARELFESALIAVASADGIALNEQGPEFNG